MKVNAVRRCLTNGMYRASLAQAAIKAFESTSKIFRIRKNLLRICLVHENFQSYEEVDRTKI